MPIFGTIWSIRNVKLGAVVPVVIASVTIVFSSPALATGTKASVVFLRTAELGYQTTNARIR